MTEIINTEQWETLPTEGLRGHLVYCGLDTTLTLEILERIETQLSPQTNAVYQFEKSLQAPALEMTLRGILTDRIWRNKAVSNLKVQETILMDLLQEFAMAAWDKPLNPASPQQLKYFFYTHMKIPEIKVMTQGVWQVSTNREALEKMQIYLYARPFCNLLLALRDVTKKIQTLTTGIDGDSRFRTGINISGTKTGRWSTSENAFGTGGNSQNITGELRRPLVADPGWKMAYIDLEQAESRAVGILAFLATGQDTYLRACEAGDLHTTVSRLCWPELPWTADDKANKDIAERPFYRMFSYRDLAKRGGHGTNYYGQPNTIAKNLKIERSIAETFQTKYFKAFPEIPMWHEWTKRELRTTGKLSTPLGRVRHFFDRLDDDSTLRGAIAHVPQSMIADMLNGSLLQIWINCRKVQLLLQVHDAIVIQYREEDEDEVLPEVLKFMRTEYFLGGRKFSIGSDALVGWNWAKQVTQADIDYYTSKGKKPPMLNPDGMAKYRPGDPRKRQSQPNDRRALLEMQASG